MKYLVNILLLFIYFTGNICGQVPEQTLPDFKFYRLDQSAFTGKDVPQGKMSFFVFFDSDCEHCQLAVQNIGRQYEAFKKAWVYMVSVDNKDKIIHFMDSYGRNLKGQKNVVVLQDKLNQFMIKFKPRKYPAMFLYSAEKKLIGYEDNEEAVFRFLKLLPAK